MFNFMQKIIKIKLIDCVARQAKRPYGKFTNIKDELDKLVEDGLLEADYSPSMVTYTTTESYELACAQEIDKHMSLMHKELYENRQIKVYF